MSMPEWKQKFLDRVITLPLSELLIEVMQASAGDDYDGCFTERGRFEFAVLRKELSTRLLAARLLTVDESQEIERHF